MGGSCEEGVQVKVCGICSTTEEEDVAVLFVYMLNLL